MLTLETLRKLLDKRRILDAIWMPQILSTKPIKYENFIFDRVLDVNY